MAFYHVSSVITFHGRRDCGRKGSLLGALRSGDAQVWSSPTELPTLTKHSYTQNVGKCCTSIRLICSGVLRADGQCVYSVAVYTVVESFGSTSVFNLYSRPIGCLGMIGCVPTHLQLCIMAFVDGSSTT